MKKAFIMLMSLVAMMAASTSLKAQEVAIELVPGWNWIAYPYAETVDLNTALGSFTPAVGDMIKSQFGNSTYSYGRWRGAVQSLNAGEGYHYFSNRTEPVILVFGLPSIPIGTLTVTTSEPTNITSTTAACGGSAVSNDDTSILMKGVCWATHPQPTTNDSYTEDGSGPGAFTATMTALDPETEYYVRAYAVSVKGINYGEELSFTTESGIPMGAINGLFSVSENNQVYFSKGNLQYQASTDTWRFAENQWDYVGEDNNNASATYEGWIDLFAWGTSGYDHGAVCYQPWTTGGQYDHAAYAHNEYDLCDGNGQADWGYNAISNSGNQERLWRTCKSSEWQYLMQNRQTPSGIRFAKAVVNGRNGLIILPDDWDPSVYVLNNTNEGNVSYEANTISAEDWNSLLENNGAVFLPATDMEGNTHGAYWTASATGTPWMKRRIDFSNNYLSLGGSYYPDERYSVRLVRSAPTNPTYSFEAVPNPSEGGTISGAGNYDYYASVVLTAIPNEGYTFYQWKENGKGVSMDNPSSFVSLFDRSLEACFLENSTYPLLYTYNDNNHTATVIGHWDGQDATGDLVIPETVMHNGEAYTVTAIGGDAFFGCTGLTTVALPNSLNSIGGYAFYDCSSLTSVEIPYGVTSIGSLAFNGTSIVSMVIPESVTSLGNQVFYGCGNLTSVTLPSGITSLGYGLFQYCGSLSSITIPAGVIWISQYAFLGCGLTSITILAEVPASIHEQAFESVNKSIPVYVPCGTLEAYQNADGWNQFTNIVAMCPGVIIVMANSAEYGTVSGGGSFEGGETCIVTATPNEGYFFESWTENGEVVSTDATYSFIVTGDRNLVANFAASAPTGAIDGKFTINDNGDQVYFSQGNLQYQASTDTWKFADNQFDYVGSTNSNISSTYSGWIDLFGWGTSGYNHGANCYQPWSTSTNNSDYYAYGNDQYNLYDQTGQADWGYNPISNGGNTANQWRTLTQPEWNYVLHTRTTTSGIRYAKANVNNVNGMILLPDDWSASTYSLSNTNSSGASFSSNTMTASQWSTLEQAGAVFLPATGNRYGTSVNNVGYGVYWSTSCSNSSLVYFVGFNDSNLFMGDGGRYYGSGVRLVRVAEN